MVKEYPTTGRYGERERLILPQLSDSLTVKPIMERGRDGLLASLVFPYVEGETAQRRMSSNKNKGRSNAELAYRIGETTAHMHVELESVTGVTQGTVHDLWWSLSERVRQANRLVDQQTAVILTSATHAVREMPIRLIPFQPIHGDYHLEQILVTPSNDLKVIDFDGAPLEMWCDRIRESHPAQDIAGMLRSFDYLGDATEEKEEFIEGYKLHMFGTEPGWEEMEPYVNLYMLHRVLYEFLYECQVDRGKTEQVRAQIPPIAEQAIRAAES